VFLLAFVAAPEASAVVGREALERYRPLLFYDSAERYFAQPVSRRPRRIGRDLVYGRVAHEAGETWLQYWFFYAYNSQDRGLFRTGRHEGDWEFVQLRLGEDGRPRDATLAQHSWAVGCELTDLRAGEQPRHPVPAIYVANGSHASYPSPGSHDRPWPDPDDEADGRGRVVRPDLVRISDDRPGWVASDDPWGDSRAGVIPGEESSPLGPRYQPDERWSRPTSFHAELARPCLSSAPGLVRETVLIVLLIACAALGLLLLLRRRVGRAG
jgi:hypothetical protein